MAHLPHGVTRNDGLVTVDCQVFLFFKPLYWWDCKDGERRNAFMRVLQDFSVYSKPCVGYLTKSFL